MKKKNYQWNMNCFVSADIKDIGIFMVSELHTHSPAKVFVKSTQSKQTKKI